MKPFLEQIELSDELLQFLLVRYAVNAHNQDEDNGTPVSFYDGAPICYIPRNEYKLWKRVLAHGSQKTAPARFMEALAKQQERARYVKEHIEKHIRTADNDMRLEKEFERWIRLSWLWDEPKEKPSAQHLFLSRMSSPS